MERQTETRQRQVTQTEGLEGLGVLYLPRGATLSGLVHSLTDRMVIRVNQ